VITGFFNGQDFLKPYFVTPTGNSDNRHCIMAGINEDKLGVQNLDRLSKWLRQVDYHGPVNMRLSLVGGEVFARSMRMGFNFPDIYAMLENLDVDIGTFFNALAYGINLDLKVNSKFCGAIDAITKKDDLDIMHGAPILVEDEKAVTKIFSVGTMRSDIEKKDIFISGEIDTVFVATASGSTLNETRKRMLRTLNNITFPSMTFNPHIHMIGNKTFDKLEERAYLNG
jgi:hypothetical protein